MQAAEALKSYRDELTNAFNETPFLVFLCGPSIARAGEKPSASARRQIKEILESQGFTVVLGEDDGLDSPEIKALGIDAQDNELEFIRKCNAVIVIADSVGSFCELGDRAPWSGVGAVGK
jgi:hypothetical protein